MTINYCKKIFFLCVAVITSDPIYAMDKSFLNLKIIGALNAAILPAVQTMQNSCVTNCEKSCGFSCDTLFDNSATFIAVGSSLYVVAAGMGFFFWSRSCKKAPVKQTVND